MPFGGCRTGADDEAPAMRPDSSSFTDYSVEVGSDVFPETFPASSVTIESDGLQEIILENEKLDFESGWCHSAPITNAGKRQQQVKMVLLILIPFATLLSVALYMNTDSIFAMIQADQTKSTVEFSVYVGRLIVVLQKEQDQSVLYLSSIGPETKFFLTQTYMETDLYLVELPYWPVGLDRSDRKFFNSKNDFQSYLQRHRDELGHSNVSIYDEIRFYKNSIDVFLIWLYDALKESRYSSLWKTLVAYQKVIFCVHYAGIERALGTTYFVEGGFSDPYLYIKYNEVVYVFKNNFEAAMKYSPLVKPISEYNALVNGENLTTIIERYRDQIQFQNISAPSLNDAAAWFDFMSTYLDILFQFQTELAEDILQILNERSERVLTDVASSSLVICVVIIILPITLRAIYNLTNDIQTYAISLAHKTRELNNEKRRTDSLLHQMLPKTVAERLKRKRGSLAEYFKEVTILFSDIPGFSRMASELAPTEIVQVLNHIYTIFDGCIEKYDAYKVETIGDSYMVASGLPKPNERRHAVEIASMSLDLMEVSNQLDFSDLQVPVESVKLRIGIHTGPVVAGVVGMKLPRYCLFGDTVNTASRMEKHGEANRIHVSATTWKLLMRYGKGFLLSPRGKVDLKGKGRIESFWLDGRMDAKDLEKSNSQYERNAFNMKMDRDIKQLARANKACPKWMKKLESQNEPSSPNLSGQEEEGTRQHRKRPSPVQSTGSAGSKNGKIDAKVDDVEKKLAVNVEEDEVVIIDAKEAGASPTEIEGVPLVDDDEEEEEDEENENAEILKNGVKDEIKVEEPEEEQAVKKEEEKVEQVPEPGGTLEPEEASRDPGTPTASHHNPPSYEQLMSEIMTHNEIV